MSNPVIRSEGGVRRFVVHAAHEPRDRGKVVRATGFEAAALAFAEAWRPVPDADGTVHLVLFDLDSGERQEAAVDVARPGVADLQVRKARLEARAAVRAETPPGAERFAIGPLTRGEPPMSQTNTSAPRRWLMNAAAAFAVILVAALAVTQLLRERMSETPWADAAAPAATAPAPPLRAAVLQAAPSTLPPATPAPAAAVPPARPSAAGRVAARPAPPSSVQAVDPGDGVLTLPEPDIDPEPLALPASEPPAEAEAPEPAAPEAPPAPEEAPLLP